MTDGQLGPRKGRPLKFPGSGARLPHSVRLKPAVAEKLRAQAAVNLRSIGEEIEARIDASFLQEGSIPVSGYNDIGLIVKYFEDRLQKLEDHIYARVDEHAVLQTKVNMIQMQVIDKLLFDRVVDERSKLEAEKHKRNSPHDREIAENNIAVYEDEVGILKRLQRLLSQVSKEVSNSMNQMSKRPRATP